VTLVSQATSARKHQVTTHRHTAHGFKHASFTFTLITYIDMFKESVSLVTKPNKTTQCSRLQMQQR